MKINILLPYKEKFDSITKRTADPIVPYLNAVSALFEEKALTVNIPSREQIIPSDAKAKGIN